MTPRPATMAQRAASASGASNMAEIDRLALPEGPVFDDVLLVEGTPTTAREGQDRIVGAPSSEIWRIYRLCSTGVAGKELLTECGPQTRGRTPKSFNPCPWIFNISARDKLRPVLDLRLLSFEQFGRYT